MRSGKLITRSCPLLSVTEHGQPVKPWLTIILDDYSRGCSSANTLRIQRLEFGRE